MSFISFYGKNLKLRNQVTYNSSLKVIPMSHINYRITPVCAKRGYVFFSQVIRFHQLVFRVLLSVKYVLLLLLIVI